MNAPSVVFRTESRKSLKRRQHVLSSVAFTKTTHDAATSPEEIGKKRPDDVPTSALLPSTNKAVDLLEPGSAT